MCKHFINTGHYINLFFFDLILGGHTSEMLTLLKSLTNKYNPRIYVHADTDHGSLKKIESLENENDYDYEVRDRNY